MVRYCPSETMSSDCLSYDKKIAHETSICRPLLNSVVSCVFQRTVHEGEGIILNDWMTSDKNWDHDPSTWALLELLGILDENVLLVIGEKN